MWPFRSKPKALAKLDYETICPLCFERYGVREIITAYPMCPDCSSEAIDIEVEPYDSFMASKTYADLDEVLRRWEQVDGFLPAYKEAKTSRIRALRDKKMLEH